MNRKSATFVVVFCLTLFLSPTLATLNELVLVDCSGNVQSPASQPAPLGDFPIVSSPFLGAVTLAGGHELFQAHISFPIVSKLLNTFRDTLFERMQCVIIPFLIAPDPPT